MLAVIVKSYVNFVKESVVWNVHTYEVIQEPDDVLISLLNMETGGRRYVITKYHFYYQGIYLKYRYDFRIYSNDHIKRGILPQP